MKKKLLTALLAVSLAAALTACGTDKKDDAVSDNSATTESEDNAEVKISSKDFDPDKYAKIGDFEGAEVTVDTYNFSDADVESRMNEEFKAYVTYSNAYDYTPLDKKTVENGDVVNIDYEGKKDGVAFQGGTAQGSHLTIGSNTFIDGFETGLIGHNVGDKVELNLTFPADYQNTDLAGQAVVFSVTINSIDEEKMPQLTDAIVPQMQLGFNTVDEYRENVKTQLQQSCDEQNSNNRKQAVWEAVYKTCEVSDPPQEFVDSIATQIKANAQSYADYYGVALTDFIQQYLGMTQEQYDAEIQKSAADSAKEKLAMAAIAKKQNIEVTDDDMKASAEKEFKDYGYDSADAMLDGIGKASYYDYVLADKVNEFLMGKVKITENAPVSIMANQNGAVSDDSEAVEAETEDTQAVEGTDNAEATDADAAKDDDTEKAVDSADKADTEKTADAEKTEE